MPSSPVRPAERAAVAADDAQADLWAARWAWRALGLVAALCALRLIANAFPPSALHFDEAQYWTYGEELAGGYYSKPPLAAWLIRLSTEIFGDTIFGVRFFAPLTHGAIAWLLFAMGRRLYDARTGFWAAAAYASLPAVAWSSGMMTTDPPMMTAWALALYALIRAAEAEGRGSARLGWWALMGGAIGLGLLGKYTMIAFVGGVIGYALISRRRGSRGDGRGDGRVDTPGLLVAALAALAAFSPNLVWNAANDFAAFSHVGDNAKLGGGPKWRFDKALEFAAMQAVIIGPILFVGLIGAARERLARWSWSHRLLLWLALPLPLAMLVQAFLSRAHPNWAAPAYVAGTLLAAAWLLARGRSGWLKAHLALGLSVQMALIALGAVYASQHETLPRAYDPQKKMRVHPAVCAEALAHLPPGGVLASNDRRLLANCMFDGGLGTDRIRIWNPDGRPGNHYELTSSLRVGEAERPMVLVLLTPPETAVRILGRFETAEILTEATLATHASGKPHRIQIPYLVAAVAGFKGY